MNREIFLIQKDGQLVGMREHAYDSEALLQGLLARYPHLLVGDQIDPAQPRRWLLISSETGLPSEEGGNGRWAIDHLFLDQDAIPTIVEVKRSSDTRIRREVVGQMLDYAANAVVYWPIETLQDEFRQQCQRRNADPDIELAGFLGPGQDPDAFWQQAKTNLQAGKVRLLFVADEIPPELRRIVEFLNRQMDPAEVLAIEIKQYVGSEIKTLVPTVVGQTAEEQQRKAGTRTSRQWDEASFFETLRQGRPAAEVEVARRFLKWATERKLRVWWGKGQQTGSFMPVLDLPSVSQQLFAVYSSGGVEIEFQYYISRGAFASEDKRRELQRRLNAISGVKIPDDAIARRPNIPLTTLARGQATEEFLAVFDWFIQEVQKG
jgi:hypothetical protein